MRQMLATVCAVVGTLLCAILADAQPFTYQGMLKQAGVPANGNFDFQFSLWTAVSGGSQVGSTLTRSGVTVAWGVFSVELDFGGVWDGSDRYLQIAVRPAGSGSYTTLSPRVRVNRTPYSQFAFSVPWSGIVGMPAGFADGVDNDTTYSAGAGLQLVGTTFSVATGGIVTGMLANGAVTTDKIADGAVTDAKLSSTGVAAGTYGSGTQIPQFTVNAQGRITGVTNVTISGVSPGGSAGGDLSGSYPNPTVARIQGRAVSSTAPTTGQVLKWDGSAWSPANDAGGDSLWQQSGTDIFYNLGNVGIGTNAPAWPLHVWTNTQRRAIMGTTIVTGGGGEPDQADGVMGYVQAASGDVHGVHGETNSTGGKGVFGWATASTGPAWGVAGVSNSSAGYGVYGAAAADTGSTVGVHGRAVSPDGTGVQGVHLATTGTAPGVHGITNSTSNNAVGVLGEVSSTSPGVYSAAVRGINRGTGELGIGVWGSQDGSGWGVYGTSASGIGVLGESASNTGVLGLATASSGATYGVYGQSNSTDGTGVFGRSVSPNGTGVYGLHAATTGTAPGVRGITNSTSDYAVGVLGEVSPTSPGAFSAAVRGINRGTGGTGIGVWGSQAGSGWGVLGEVPSGTSGYAVYSFGRFAATGTKSLQIDHPLSPETHYLNHFCAEGPEPYNLYRGTVVLDARGEAWVQLPDYFESINRDPTYHLTPIGAPMPNLHVAVEIQNNRFKIAGGVPGKKVSWEVKAIRNDRWVQQYGYQTEQVKPQEFQGKYLHPELYGQPKELGIFYHPEPAQETPVKQ